MCNANVNSPLASFDVCNAKFLETPTDVFIINFDCEWKNNDAVNCIKVHHGIIATFYHVKLFRETIRFLWQVDSR